MLRVAIGNDLKGRSSPPLYCVGIALYVLVALIWLVPDRRVERLMAATGER